MEAHRSRSPQSLEEGVLEDLGLDAQWTRRVFAELGQDEQAMQGLLQAYEARSGAYDILSLRFSDLYPALRGDPRFQDLVELIGPGG